MKVLPQLNRSEMILGGGGGRRGWGGGGVAKVKNWVSASGTLQLTFSRKLSVTKVSGQERSSFSLFFSCGNFHLWVSIQTLCTSREPS